jgi:6-phosphogluconolactonase
MDGQMFHNTGRPVSNMKVVTMIRVFLSSVVGCVFFLSAIPSQAASFVYVSLAGEAAISIWQMDEKTGELTHRTRVEVEGEPGCLTTDPQQRFMFASLRTAGKIASYRIDPATGGLSLIGVISADADPAYLATDRSGRYLMSAYYFAGRVAVHPIGEDGSLEEATGRWTDTEDKAHAIDADPSNRLVLVPHTGPNAVFQFRFDASSGQLTPSHPDRLQLTSNTGPRHLAFHPRRPWAFFDNEQGSAVTACRYSVRKGVLTPVQTLPTIPEDFTAGNSCAHLELHPSGSFLYAANRGHDSIAMFQVNQLTGKIRSIGQVSTEKTPRSFNIEPSGRFLFAAGQGSAKLAAYRIDLLTGELDRTATYDVGERPWWVKTIRFK